MVKCIFGIYAKMITKEMRGFQNVYFFIYNTIFVEIISIMFKNGFQISHAHAATLDDNTFNAQRDMLAKVSR